MDFKRKVIAFLVFAFFGSPIATGRAQVWVDHAGGAHPKVAVVLSGGSAKGFAHIGVLQALEDAGVPIDLVTGTSMGAIIGGLYAVGYSSRDLERLAITEDWSNFFKRPTDRRDRALADKDQDQRYALTFPLNRARPGLPAGFISRQGIAKHIERLTWPVSADTDFSTLPTAYAALVTDLATGRPILLRTGSIAQAMEASAAVPGAFAPVRLSDGRLAVDGAVVRNIPASDARSLGADIVICVDVSEHVAPVNTLRSLVDIVDQTVAFRVQASNVTELPLCTVVIDPDISGLPSVAFGRATEWIARGRAAADAHRAALTAIADSVRRLRGVTPVRPPMRAVDSVFVRSVRWTPVSVGADGIVRGTHELRDSSWLSLAKVERAVTRLYSTGRFDQVSFRLVPNGTSNDLIFDLTEGDRDVLGLGVRYDTPKGVALLANATVADWFSPGSNASISARLGGDQQFDIRDVLGAGPNAHFTQTYRATATKTTLPQFRLNHTTPAPTFDVQELAFAIERDLSSSASIGVELEHQWSQDGADTATAEWRLRRQSFTTLAATVRIDTYDRSDSPTRGFVVRGRSEGAAHDREGNSPFARHFLDAQGVYSITSWLTMTGRVDVGYATGDSLPAHDRFLLGGSVPSTVWSSRFIPFLGLAPQSRVGTAIQMVQGGMQANAWDRGTVAFRWNIGNVFDAWPMGVHRSQYIGGAGLTIGTMLPPGPLSVTIASHGLRTTPLVEVSFGSLF